MELRSRKKASCPPVDDISVGEEVNSGSDEVVNSGLDEDVKGSSDEEVNGSTDDEVYAPSSESDPPISADEGEVCEEHEADEDVDLPILVSTRIRKGNGRKADTRRKRKRDKQVLMWEVWGDENERWIDEHLEDDYSLDQQNAVIAETAEPPPNLIIPLLRYQKEWLAWALKQEDSPVRGGILADEMGMGKTIQAISLVLAKREIERAISGVQLDSSEVKATLVICPVVAVTQWVNEIDRFTDRGSTKVLVYHGPKRGKTIKQFADYDFVITTYATVEFEFRKYMMPPKVDCQYCGKSLYPQKLQIHLKYFCGPSAVKTEKQSKQQRKNSKASAFKQDEKTRKCKTNKKGGNKKETRKKSEQYEDEDICPAVNLPSGKSVLHSVKWHRIVLDEVTCMQ